MDAYTDNTSLTENLGKHGGVTVRAPDPSPEELEALKARIRRSWTDPVLRLRLQLPPMETSTEGGFDVAR